MLPFLPLLPFTCLVAHELFYASFTLFWGCVALMYLALGGQ